MSLAFFVTILVFCLDNLVAGDNSVIATVNKS